MNKQRLTDAIVTRGSGFNQFPSNSGTITNPMYGGINGIAPNYEEWVSAVQERVPHGIPFLIDAPKGFDHLPDKGTLVAQLRQILEVHPRKIEGFEGGITIDNADIPWGGGGQKLSVFTDIKREETNVKATIDEKEGGPIRLFWEYYAEMLMGNTESKIPGIATLDYANDPALKGLSRPTNWMADMWTWTMGFILPDPLHRYVKQSWIVTNLYLKGGLTGISGSRELEQAMSTRQYNLEFGGLAMYGKGVDKYCQKYLDRMNLAGANPLLRKPWVQDLYGDNIIDPDVLAAVRGLVDITGSKTKNDSVSAVSTKNVFGAGA